MSATSADDQFNLITLLVVSALCLAVLVYIYKTFSRSKGESILLVGNSGAGKTRIFEVLRTNRLATSFTSMQANEDTFIPYQLRQSKHVKVAAKFVDYPGHPSLRLGLSEQYAAARGVVFVTALPTTDKQLKQQLQTDCKFLFKVLTDKELTSRRVPILIACAHNDPDEAKAARRLIVKTVEEQLTQLRDNQSSMINLGDAKQSGVVELGKKGLPFQLSDSRCPLTLGQICLPQKDVNDINAWFAKL